MVDIKINKKTVSSVHGYLQLMVEFKKQHKHFNGWKYAGTEDFILQNGRSMKSKPFPKEFGKMGKEKQCFQNAFLLADAHDLIYCEGIAFSIIPTLHAWCLHEGEVIDPTWSDGEDYFGVEIPLEIGWEIMRRKGTFGLIEAWEIGFPLVSGEIVLEKSGR